MDYCHLDSPVGTLCVAGDEDGLRAIEFERSRWPIERGPDWREDPSRFRDVAEQLTAYFAGELQRFDLRLAPRGTSFQREVWRELVRIPYGRTIGYGELARRIGRPNASRAVGAANGRNPLSIVVPCHRVIGSTGALTGFAGGLPIKRALLAHERSHCADGGQQALPWRAAPARARR